MKERLARARQIQEMLDAGEAESCAAVARQSGVTPSAVVRLLSLLRLAPEIQSHIVAATGALGEYMLTEKVCRKLVRLRSRARQLEVFRELIGAQAASAGMVETGRAAT